MTNNQLVVYSNTALDLAAHVQTLEVPLNSMDLSHRVVVDGGMYSAGIRDIAMDAHGLEGIAYIAYWKDVTPPAETAEALPQVPASLTRRLMEKVFGAEVAQKIAPAYEVEHEGKQYARDWTVSVGRHDWKARLFYPFEGRQSFSVGTMAELRAQVVNQRQVSLSNDMMGELFNPLFPALMSVYGQLAR